MSVVIIMGAATLITAPLEAVAARRNRRRVRVYRKPDPPKRHKKSPSTVQSNELFSLYLF